MNNQPKYLCRASDEVLHHLELYQSYLEINPQDDTPALPVDLTDAFVCGYVNGLYKTHTYSEIFFLSGKDLRRVISLELQDLVEKTNSPTRECIANCTFRLAAEKYPDLKVVRRELPEAFIAGYLASLHAANKFDPVFFVEGYQVRSLIYADLLSATKKNNNALRAAARIHSSRLISKEQREQIRDMLFNADATTDNEEHTTPRIIVSDTSGSISSSDPTPQVTDSQHPTLDPTPII